MTSDTLQPRALAYRLVVQHLSNGQGSKVETAALFLIGEHMAEANKLMRQANDATNTVVACAKCRKLAATHDPMGALCEECDLMMLPATHLLDPRTLAAIDEYGNKLGEVLDHLESVPKVDVSKDGVTWTPAEESGNDVANYNDVEWNDIETSIPPKHGDPHDLLRRAAKGEAIDPHAVTAALQMTGLPNVAAVLDTLTDVAADDLAVTVGAEPPKEPTGK